MSLKRVLWLAMLAFLMFFIVQAPAEAARVVKVTGESLGSWISAIAESLLEFVKTLL